MTSLKTFVFNSVWCTIENPNGTTLDNGCAVSSFGLMRTWLNDPLCDKDGFLLKGSADPSSASFVRLCITSLSHICREHRLPLVGPDSAVTLLRSFWQQHHHVGYRGQERPHTLAARPSVRDRDCDRDCLWVRERTWVCREPWELEPALVFCHNRL